MDTSGFEVKFEVRFGSNCHLYHLVTLVEALLGGQVEDLTTPKQLVLGHLHSNVVQVPFKSEKIKIITFRDVLF